MSTYLPDDREPRKAQDAGREASRTFPDLLEDPRPEDKQTWEASPLGSSNTWPESLRDLSKAIVSFPHPACVFWGEAMISVHNQEWTTATGLDDQGRKQRGKLSEDAFDALNASLLGKPQKRVDSLAFSTHDQNGEASNHVVSISPLFDEATPKEDGAHGSLVQLIRKPHGRPTDEAALPPERMQDSMPGNGLESESVSNRLGTPPELAAFDKHPFFSRFAEMLPTGLAILDHNAQAVFVNRTFHELTTHCDDDQHFTSWSQAIHPDDQERVMSGYRHAFASHKQLRTEFRTVGNLRPWRLLFMMPFDGDDIQHISIQDHGGFICCILDITCEKGAELVEREAAKGAVEARVRQERFIDMISHEIRNPLSAMLHCTEDIEEAVGDPANFDLFGVKEAIETINICVQVSAPKAVWNERGSFS
jgi:hypothetical protein